MQLPQKIKIKVIPGAKLNQLTCLADGSYKIHLNVLPVDGKANLALIDFLANHFKLRKKQITVLSGHTSRNKMIELSNLD